MEHRERVVLALGSNLGDRSAYLTRGVARLGRALQVVRVSSVYESAPEGDADQPAYLNLVLEGETAAGPRELLEVVQDVERAEGRLRGEAGGPRTLDVDIVFYGRQTVRERDLVIPHPRWRERGFVLVPLAEIAPRWEDPESGEPVERRLASSPGLEEGVRRVAPPPAVTARESGPR